ncbi:BamA/TamA family outer membrane protein, partial [bacterium]|nr:BamA/TamA family outer membrane protein [bacterium]
LSSFSYRYEIPKFNPFDSYLEFRFDFAGMWDRKVNIQRDEFLVAVGAKFSIATPLGPFSVAYGVNSKKLSKLYFSLGYDF